METIGPDGVRQSLVLDVRSITPQPPGAFEVVLESPDGTSQRWSVPPRLAYSPGAVGSITTRNEKLLSVTVPAGAFAAGRPPAGGPQRRPPFERGGGGGSAISFAG